MAALNQKRVTVQEKSKESRMKKISDLLFMHPTTQISHERGVNVFTSRKLNSLPDISTDEETKQELKVEKRLPPPQDRPLHSIYETTQRFDGSDSSKTSNSLSINPTPIHLPLPTNTDSSIPSERLWRSISAPLMPYEETENHSTYFRDNFRFVVHILRVALLETLSDIYDLREKISPPTSQASLARRKPLSDTDILTKSKFNDKQTTQRGLPALQTLRNVVLTTRKEETSNAICLIDKPPNNVLENTDHTNVSESCSKSLQICNSSDTLRESNSHHEIQEEDSLLLETSKKISKIICHEVSEDIVTKYNVTLFDEILVDAYGRKTNVQDKVISHIDIKETSETNISEVSLHRNMSNDIQLSDVSENETSSFEANALTSETDTPGLKEQSTTIDKSRRNEATVPLSQMDASSSLIEPPCKKACYSPSQFVTSLYHVQTNNFNTLIQNEGNPPMRYITTIEHTNPQNQDIYFPHARTKEPPTHEIKTQNQSRCFDKHLEELDFDHNLSEKIFQVENDSINASKYSSNKSVFQSFDAITAQTDEQNSYFSKASAMMINPGSDSVLHLPANSSDALHGSLANTYQSSQNECTPPTALTQRNYGGTNVPYKRYLVTDLQSTADGSVIPRSVVVQLRSSTLPVSTDIFQRPPSKRKYSSLSDPKQISESVIGEKDVQPCEKNLKAQMYIENLRKYATMSEQSGHTYFSNMKSFPFQSDSVSFSDPTSKNGSFANTRDATTSTDSAASRDLSHQIQSQPIFEKFDTYRLRGIPRITSVPLSNSRLSQHVNSFFIDTQGCNTSRIPQSTIRSNNDQPNFHVEGYALQDPQLTKSLPQMTFETQHNSTMCHHPPVSLPLTSPGDDQSRSQIQESKIQRNAQTNPLTKHGISGSLSTLLELPENTPVSSANQSHMNSLSDNFWNGIKNVYIKPYSLDALEQSCNYAISDTTLGQAPFANLENKTCLQLATQEEKNCEEPETGRTLFFEIIEEVVADENYTCIKGDSLLNCHPKSEHDILNSNNIPSMISMEYPFIDFLGTNNWRKEVGNEKIYENLLERNDTQQISTVIRTPSSSDIYDTLDKLYDMKMPIPLHPQIMQASAVDSQIPDTKEQPCISKPTFETSPRDVSNAPSILNNQTIAAENQVLPTIRADSCSHECPSTFDVLSPCSTLNNEVSHFCGHTEGSARGSPRKKKNGDESSLKEQSPDSFPPIRKNDLELTQVSSGIQSINLRPNLNKLGKQDNKLNKTDPSIERKVRRKILKAKRRTSQSIVNSHSIISIQTNISSRQLLEPILGTGGMYNSTTKKNQCLRFSKDYFYQMNCTDSQHELNHPYMIQNPPNNGTSTKFSPFYQHFNTRDRIGPSLSTGLTTRKAAKKIPVSTGEQENPCLSISLPIVCKRKEPYKIFGYKTHSSKSFHGKSSVENIPQNKKGNRSRQVHTPNSQHTIPWCPCKLNSSMKNTVTPRNSLGTGKRTLHSSCSSAHATQTNEVDFIPISWRKGVYLKSIKKTPNIFNKKYCSQLLLATLPFRKKDNAKKVSVDKNIGEQSEKYSDSYLRSKNSDLSTNSYLCSNHYDLQTSDNLPSNDFSTKDKSTGTSNAFCFNYADYCLWAKRTDKMDKKIAKKTSKSDETSRASNPSNNENTRNMKQNVTRKILSSFNFKSPFHQTGEQHTRNADNPVQQTPISKKKSKANTSPKTDASLQEHSSEAIRETKPRKKQTKSSQSLRDLSLQCSSFTPVKIGCSAPASERKSHDSLVQPSTFDTSYAQESKIPDDRDQSKYLGKRVRNSNGFGIFKEMRSYKSEDSQSLSEQENDSPQKQQEEPFFPESPDSQLSECDTSQSLSSPRFISSEDDTQSKWAEENRQKTKPGNCRALNKYMFTHSSLKARDKPVIPEFQESESRNSLRGFSDIMRSGFLTSRTQSDTNQISHIKAPTLFSHKRLKHKKNMFPSP